MRIWKTTNVSPHISRKAASNDAAIGSAINHDSSVAPRYIRSSVRPHYTQAVNHTEGLWVELMTTECTINVFRDEISQSLDKALRLDFGS